VIKKYIRILGTGSYLPPKILTNFDLEKTLDTTDEWISQRTGIHQRRIADKKIFTSDLAKEASIKALEAAKMKAEEIELIVVSTITPDTLCPSCANWLQAKIGAKNAVSFDITAACPGFLFALSVAQAFLTAGTYKNALVVSSEIMSREVDWNDRKSCILWGDGAGAAIIRADTEEDLPRGTAPKILSIHIHSDGSQGGKLLVPGGGSSTTPISHETVDKGLHYLKMIDANLSLREAINKYSDAGIEAIKFNNIDFSKVDIIVPHQANIRILEGMAKKIGVPMEKVYVNIDRFGNMSSATVPVALDEAVRTGKIKRGDIVLLVAFGGGLTWGSALVEW